RCVNGMALSGYIIEKYNCMTDAYTCNRLVEEAEKAGVDLRIVGIYDTALTEGQVINDSVKLKKCDFVINRYKWGKIREAINGLARRSYNLLEAFAVHVNKYEQIKRLRSEAFRMPRYICATAAISYQMLVSLLGSPFVAKGLESSMGEEVFLIENEGDYGDLLSAYGKDKEWLFQEFIQTSRGRDLRIFSIRGQVVACMKRVSQGDFRANFALGASIEPYGITAQIQDAAKDVYAQTGLDFLGIDLLFGADELVFCEINVMPGLEGIEKASGVNVAGKVIRTIKGDFIHDESRSL
ncbi:MAG: hypothetical protein QM296_06945, partial [Bacillota bacterium]|nr:hypothetical protein [Bacillota bacterium]